MYPGHKLMCWSVVLTVSIIDADVTLFEVGQRLEYLS